MHWIIPWTIHLSAVNDYVDDGLAGANSVEEAIKLCQQLHDLFSKADLVLKIWNSSEPQVLEHIPPDFRAKYSSLCIICLTQRKH
jgi:hypothetical protein